MTQYPEELKRLLEALKPFKEIEPMKHILTQARLTAGEFDQVVESVIEDDDHDKTYDDVLGFIRGEMNNYTPEDRQALISEMFEMQSEVISQEFLNDDCMKHLDPVLKVVKPRVKK